MKRQLRVLIVDDDPNWIETLTPMLDDLYDLSVASTASEALEILRNVRSASSYIDVAIVDQRLGEASGIEVIAELLVLQPGLPCIILTAFPGFEAALEAGRVGAWGYVSKGQFQVAKKLREAVHEAVVQGPVSVFMKAGESREVEFKSSARWDIRQNKTSKVMEEVIVKTVASFLNSESGGTLLIGIDDGGNVVGLERDYASLQKGNRDGFENFLMTLLGAHLGVDSMFLVRVQFHSLEGKDVCLVSVLPSPKPVYTGNDIFYVRTGNSSRPLTPREAVEFCSMRWK